MVISKIYRKIKRRKEDESLFGVSVQKLFETRLGFLVNTKFYNFFYKKVVMHKINKSTFPVYINIENTNLCNAKCIMCPREKLSRKFQDMEIGLFKKIIDDISSNVPIKKIILNGYGEPLADKHVMERIRYIKEKTKIPLLFFTNAGLLTEDVSKELISLGVEEINISFNGHDKESYEKNMGRLDYDKVSENIRRLAKLKGEKKPVVYLSCVVLEEFDKKKFVNEWEPYVEGVFFTPVQSWGGGYSGKPSAKKFGYRQGKWPCRRLWAHLFIGADGKAFLCCNDYNGDYVVGDTNESSLMEIYNSMKLKKIRDLHKDGNFGAVPICENCDAPNKCSTMWWIK